METLEMEFFMSLDHVPTCTAQQARVISSQGLYRKYDHPALATAKRILIGALIQHRPDIPITGPVEFAAEWRFDYKAGHKDGEFKVTKPDTDNLNKLLKDLMTRTGYWEDDKQVVIEHIKKVWDKKDSGIFIKIRRLGKFEEYKFG